MLFRHQNTIVSALRIAGLYSASVIGAGFASGQELTRFFTRYDEGGFYGIILASVLFSVVGYVVLSKVYANRITDFDQLVFPISGRIIGRIIRIFVTTFMLCIYCAMIAGMSAYIGNFTCLSGSAAIFLVSLVCMVVIMTGIKGIMAMSSITSPLLILGMAVSGFYIISAPANVADTEVFNFSGIIAGFADNWIFSSLLYVCYNTLSSLVVLSKLLPYLHSKKTAAAGGIIGGALLGSSAFIVNYILFCFKPEISMEFPFPGIIGLYSNTLRTVYDVVLLMAMLVTAVINGYCACDRISRFSGIGGNLIVPSFCAIAMPLCSIGFTNIISDFYPLFGYAGLLLISMVIFHNCFGRKAP